MREGVAIGLDGAGRARVVGPGWLGFRAQWQAFRSQDGSLAEKAANTQD